MLGMHIVGVKFASMKLLIVFFSLIACVTQPGSPKQSDNCWKNRETVKELTDLEGVIEKEADQLFIVLSSSRRLFPCNLSDSYQIGDSIVFSAEQKEIFPNERWAGRPIELTHIEPKN